MPASPGQQPSRRTWFDPRFGTRTLLLAVLAAAIAVSWWKDRAALEARVTSLESQLAMIRKSSAPRWGVDQVLGPPDVPQPGDDGRAWASATQTGHREWLVLHYPRAVKPAALLIYETHCPGAVDRVAVVDKRGREHVVWSGKDPTPVTALSGISRIPLQTSLVVNQVKIYLDSPNVPGWNEIDAVGLFDTAGNVQWASGAEASSTYSGGLAAGLLPSQGP